MRSITEIVSQTVADQGKYPRHIFLLPYLPIAWHSHSVVVPIRLRNNGMIHENQNNQLNSFDFSLEDRRRQPRHHARRSSDWRRAWHPSRHAITGRSTAIRTEIDHRNSVDDRNSGLHSIQTNHLSGLFRSGAPGLARRIPGRHHGLQDVVRGERPSSTITLSTQPPRPNRWHWQVARAASIEIIATHCSRARFRARCPAFRRRHRNVGPPPCDHDRAVERRRAQGRTNVLTNQQFP